MADGIIQHICHKIHVYSVYQKTKIQLERIHFTREQGEPVLSAGLCEWERVGKITQPKRGVVNFLTIISLLSAKWFNSLTTLFPEQK